MGHSRNIHIISQAFWISTFSLDFLACLVWSINCFLVCAISISFCLINSLTALASTCNIIFLFFNFPFIGVYRNLGENIGVGLKYRKSYRSCLTPCYFLLRFIFLSTFFIFSSRDHLAMCFAALRRITWNAGLINLSVQEIYFKNHCTGPQRPRNALWGLKHLCVQSSRYFEKSNLKTIELGRVVTEGGVWIMTKKNKTLVISIYNHVKYMLAHWWWDIQIS